MTYLRLLFIVSCLFVVGCQDAVVSVTPTVFVDVTETVAVEETIRPIIAHFLPTPTATATPTATPTPPPTAPPAPSPTPKPCAPGRIEQGTYSSAISGPTRTYRIYLPPCYDSDTRVFPVLYLFHGNTRGEWEWEELGIWDSAETLIQTGTIPPLLIVMPDGRPLSNTSSGGANSFETIVMDELLPHIAETYCVSDQAANRAIGGISRGGYWAFEIALRHPHQFASVGGHSAAFLDYSHDPSINPLYTMFSSDLSTLRIGLDYGADDWILSSALVLRERMISAEIPHTWQIEPNAGHDDEYWRSHVADYLEWYTINWSQTRSSYPTCSTFDE